MKPQVLVIGDLDRSLEEYRDFLQRYECIEYEVTSKEQVIEDFKTRFVGVKAIYAAWLGFAPVGGFRDEILASAPPGLQVVASVAVGYDGYDGAGMRQREIVLTNVPSLGAAVPVADLVLYNALSSFRGFALFEQNFRRLNHTIAARSDLDSRGFDSARGEPGRMGYTADNAAYAFGESLGGRPVLSPQGHHVVIVGFGNIGQLIGSRLAHIGMYVHYVKRTPLTAEQELRLGYAATYHATLTDAPEADLVVIACPATPQTRHLVNASVIDAMHKPFRIINIGRGSVIDEQALVDGLERGKVLFAGLDVFEHEPRCHPELIGRHDVVLTPHIGASTKENFDHTAVVAMRNITNVLDGGEGVTPVN